MELQPKQSPTVRIALADDQALFREGVVQLIRQFTPFDVVVSAGNGAELVAALEDGAAVDIVVTDMDMPVMNGLQVVEWCKKHKPTLPVLILTMYKSEALLIKLVKAGARGFLDKAVHPEELNAAITETIANGYYFSPGKAGSMASFLWHSANDSVNPQFTLLSDRDLLFIKLCCTELTYKEIAIKMGLGPRSIDNLRDNLFVCLDLKSRVGLVMYAVRNGLVGVSE
jgi:two-component system, NarL family, invasion response regulator UvrY